MAARSACRRCLLRNHRHCLKMGYLGRLEAGSRASVLVISKQQHAHFSYSKMTPFHTSRGLVLKFKFLVRLLPLMYGWISKVLKKKLGTVLLFCSYLCLLFRVILLAASALKSSRTLLNWFHTNRVRVVQMSRLGQQHHDPCLRSL